MTIKEVFPNPTVKQVIFQIRFPNLFYIENKIGELQLRIMKEFPESSLIYKKQFIIADIGSDVKPVDVFNEDENQKGTKIWQFSNEKGTKLNILTNSLDITSEHHKTYNNDDADKFRDTIKLVLDNFFDVMKIPMVTRVGLRYIDECPIPKLDTETFKEHYNSTFPLDRFDIAKSTEMNFRTVIQINDYYLRYVETLQKNENKDILILDFDGFAKNIDSEKCLDITDELHDLIIDEYEKSIRPPVYDIMRGSNGK